ncbi:MAG TPA: right-handed parallel beta-helix repeat-containing protein [Pirellulales bacterium]
MIRSSIGACQGEHCCAARAFARPLCAAIVVCLALAGVSQAQVIGTDGVAPVSSGSSFMSAMSLPGAQRIWGGFVGADRGLGYQGSYFSVGGLAPLTTDVLDGTWFFDGRGHVATDNGRFFGNFGLGRRTYFDPFRSIIGLSGWYDYDGDEYAGFGHSFNQMGVTGEIFNDAFDFRCNGYMPVGKNSFWLSPNEFYQHNILVLNGIDSALTGVDAKFSLRPRIMQPLNGYIDIGGYGFKSSAVSGFGGVSTGFGVQPIPGWAVNMEVNHDDTFGTTGFIRVAFSFGGSPGNSRTQNRLLEPTRRNDHIVRFNQQPEYATNPVTGQLWNVIHVDNTNKTYGAGTAENPFKTLKSGEIASAPNDIIYVHHGDGTSAFYDSGIVLKDTQQLLGSAISHTIITTEVGAFALKPIDSLNPIITNPTGAAVTLANHDVVSGFTIQSAMVGISGNGISGTIIDRNTINSSVSNSIQLTSFAGDADLSTNTITTAGADAIHVESSNGNFEVHGNTITGAKLDGIHFVDSSGNFHLHDNNISKSVHNSEDFEETTGSALLEHETLQTNALGSLNGVNVLNTAGEFTIEIKSSTIVGNGTGITVDGSGLGTVLNAAIHDNLQITSNVGDAIKVASRDSAVVNFAILGNKAINFNGITGGGGAGLRLYTMDGTLNGLVESNVFTLNAGSSAAIVEQAAGVNAVFDGDSITNLTFRSNIFNGNFNSTTPGTANGDGMTFDYHNTNTDINLLDIEGNQVLNSSGVGIGVFANYNSKPGINAVVDATIKNNLVQGSLHDGLFVVAGDGTVVRSTISSNTFNTNVSPNSPSILLDEAVHFFSTGSGALIAYVDDNSITNSGQPGTEDVSGIKAESSGSSSIALEATNNNINNSANHAITLTVADNSEMAALIRDNNLTNSHIPRDLDARIDASGTAMARLCVELTSNNSSTGYNLQNLGTGSIFGYNDNGLNVGLVNAGMNVTLEPPGTCATFFNLLSVFP